MKLGEYIKGLQDLFEQEGDLALFTASDPEGNSYNECYYLPEVRLLSPHENRHRPEYLISLPQEDQSHENWCEEHCLDEEEDKLEDFERVILL